MLETFLCKKQIDFMFTCSRGSNPASEKKVCQLKITNRFSNKKEAVRKHKFCLLTKLSFIAVLEAMILIEKNFYSLFPTISIYPNNKIRS